MSAVPPLSAIVSTPSATGSPALAGVPELTRCRLSVDQYHDRVRHGILGPRDPVERLDGFLVRKTPEGPVHAGLIDIASDVLGELVPPGWIVRPAHPITTGESEPEPAVAVVRGIRRDHLGRHPRPQDCAVVVETSNASVARDRGFKRQLYARAGVPVYWIVVLPERAVEVYTGPSGPAAEPANAAARRFADGDRVPVVIDGVEVGAVAVADLLP